MLSRYLYWIGEAMLNVMLMKYRSAGQQNRKLPSYIHIIHSVSPLKNT